MYLRLLTVHSLSCSIAGDNTTTLLAPENKNFYSILACG